MVYGNRPRPRPGADPLGHGRRVDSLDGSAEPSEECLRSHRWVWNGSRLEGLLTTSGTPVFVCGTAVNKMGSWTCSLRSIYSGSTPGSKKIARSHTRRPPTRSGRSGKRGDPVGAPKYSSPRCCGWAQTRLKAPPAVVDQILAQLPGLQGAFTSRSPLTPGWVSHPPPSLAG